MGTNNEMQSVLVTITGLNKKSVWNKKDQETARGCLDHVSYAVGNKDLFRSFLGNVRSIGDVKTQKKADKFKDAAFKREVNL